MKGSECPKKRNLQVLGNFGSRHHRTRGDERKNFLKTFQTKEKNSRKQALQQESDRRDKHLGCPPCKIIGTILKMDKKEPT